MINDGTEDRILAFATVQFLRFMCESKKLFMDGTFYTSPPVFTQMYTIHGYYMDKQVIPMIYAFLPNKSKETYLRLFTLIRQKV